MTVDYPNPHVVLVGPAVHLTEMALAADPQHQPALEARLKAVEALHHRCRNSNERARSTTASRSRKPG